jgi:hypothetical protein
MKIRMQVVGRDAATRLCFPDYEDGSRLEELTSRIAGALDTDACHPKGSSLERLISFDAYPEEFALWWDGFTCELGCSAPCGVAMDAVADRLLASGAFEAA